MCRTHASVLAAGASAARVRAQPVFRLAEGASDGQGRLRRQPLSRSTEGPLELRGWNPPCFLSQSPTGSRIDWSGPRELLELTNFNYPTGFATENLFGRWELEVVSYPVASL